MGRLLAVASLAIVVAAGCGGKHAAGPAGCIRIFFVPHASGAQIARVRRRLAELDDGVASIRFVSKQQALARMRRRYPEFTYDMPYNPLPASLSVGPESRSDGQAIVRELEQKPAGVHVVKYLRKRRRC
jgi:cell division protein FtsX